MEQQLPNIEFEDGRLHPDSEAYAALLAMGPGELAEKVNKLEGQYVSFRATHTLRYKLAMWLGDVPFRVFRQQIAVLAREHQKITAEQKATAVQANVGSEFIRLNDELRSLRKFVAENFELQLGRAVGRNQPLLELVKELLLGVKD